MGPEIQSIDLRRPTLDDVFMKLTGRAIRDEGGSQKDEMARHARLWMRNR